MPDMINVALPKGRLGENVYALFVQAGYALPGLIENSRKLIFENPDAGVRFFWVKPGDVPVYVSRGAADVGIAGKDVILESEPDVYELADLGLGQCRLAVAAREDFRDDPRRPLRVATKYERVAQRYYQSLGREIDIIHLNGSIELAPIAGLSDVILDIVETGATLRENHLKVIETVTGVSARLIANKAAWRFHEDGIARLVKALSSQNSPKEEIQ